MAGNPLAHAKHSVNLGYSKPVKDIGHQRLETHVLHACNVLGSFEILRSAIQTTFSSIIHKILHQGIRKLSRDLGTGRRVGAEVDAGERDFGSGV